MLPSRDLRARGGACSRGRNNYGKFTGSWYMAPKGGAPRGGPRVKKEGQTADLYRIGGVDLPYDPELELDKPKPTPLFPEYKPSLPDPLTEDEKREIAHYKAFREKVRNGPHYTILGDNVRVTKPGEKPNKPAASFNAFEGMPRYSDRYKRKNTMIPKLDTRPYVKAFFPEELWSTIDPHYNDQIPEMEAEFKAYQKKNIKIPGIENLNDAEPELSGDEGEEKPARDPEDEDPLMGEEVDDEYDDDDEDGGDYNAEQYFDDGGDDGGEDYDAGGDDGGGGWID